MSVLERINWRTVIARGLIVVGLGMIGYFYGTGIYTAGVQNRLRAEWQDVEEAAKATPAAATTDTAVGGTETPGSDLSGSEIFGRIVIPKLGVDMIVLEGAGRANLTRGPSRITGTSAPHEGRNTAISAHRTTYAAPFRHLDRLEDGDIIKVITVRGQYKYRVTGRASVRPTDRTVIGQNFTDRLTLTTCDPPGSAARRLAVWAELGEKSDRETDQK